jgi:hypothetical protein
MIFTCIPEPVMDSFTIIVPTIARRRQWMAGKRYLCFWENISRETPKVSPSNITKMGDATWQTMFLVRQENL